MTPHEWLEIIRREYLRDFIRRGGAAVKFVVPMEEIKHDELLSELRKTAEEEGFLFAYVDAASTKIHMIDKLFHKVALQVDWDRMAYSFVTQIFKENGYELPAGDEFNLQQIALLNGREEKFLGKDLQKWLEREIYRDFKMSQEFRFAMIRLCMDQLVPDNDRHMSNAIKEWLRGELRLISALKGALIFQKVARHNARHMLFSLAHWLKKNGKNGLVLSLDISRYLISKRTKDPAADGFYYSVPATMDAYEVLRQFIDATDELESCLITVMASRDFLTDDRRGLDRYDALKLRIWDEVRDRNRQNPLAALIRLA